MKMFSCDDCKRLLTCACETGPNHYSYSWVHSHYGLGAIRCTSCGHARWVARQEAEAKAERERMDHHLASNHEDGEVCEECCEHEFDPDEGFMCLHCGAEGFERMAGAYEDYGSDR